jgi:prepilin-type N-terminal cleavage/methylation domain-containing protein
MSILWKKIRKSKGFTLVELLVVIAIIGILVSIVMPAINDALFRGKLTSVAANGRNLHIAMISRETESIYRAQAPVWPTVGTSNIFDSTRCEFENSTYYFESMVTNDVLNVSFGFFAAPGVTSASGDDPGGFEPLNNAWCVVAGVQDSTRETLPVFFTRNLMMDKNYSQPTEVNYLKTPTSFSGSDNEPPEELLANVRPFGEKGFVFVTKGGAGYALFKDDVRLVNFTNLFQIQSSDTTYTNLYPGTSSFD